MVENWFKIILVALSIAGLMLALSIIQRKRHLHAEIARKLMHIGSGVVALSLPRLFTEKWPVFLLTVLAASGMFAVKYTKSLQGNIGAVTGSVMRNTLGEICFPIGAGILFFLSKGDALLYSIPLLILTFADATAALIGVFYGVMRYTTSDGTKTLEGSLAFFQAAFLSTLVPLLLFTDIGRTETLLIALLMALLSMLLDAIAWWGLDNLLIPVLSFLALRAFIHLDGWILTLQLVVTMTLLIFVLYWRKRTTLNDSAVLATAIYGYFCWALGGWQWVLPPLILFLSYNVLSPRDADGNKRPYTVQVVLGVGAVGLFWLILADVFENWAFYFPFMLSFAAQLAMIGSARTLRVAGQRSLIMLLARNIIVSWLLLFIPFALIGSLPNGGWIYAVSALFSIGIGVTLFALTQSGPDGYRNATPRWMFQALSAGLASLIGLAAVQMV
jgi:phytol kinase